MIRINRRLKLLAANLQIKFFLLFVYFSFFCCKFWYVKQLLLNSAVQFLQLYSDHFRWSVVRQLYGTTYLSRSTLLLSTHIAWWTGWSICSIYVYIWLNYSSNAHSECNLLTIVFQFISIKIKQLSKIRDNFLIISQPINILFIFGV